MTFLYLSALFFSLLAVVGAYKVIQERRRLYVVSIVLCLMGAVYSNSLRFRSGALCGACLGFCDDN